MTTHRILLRGPWMVTMMPPAAEPVARRVTLPADWMTLFGPSAGVARFQRTFHRPTNLDADERVDVVLAGCGGRGQLWLNGEPLREWDESVTQLRLDVTSRLLSFNRLEIELAYDPQQSPAPGGLHDVVLLEIDARPEP